jgi:hypothetical protein
MADIDQVFGAPDAGHLPAGRVNNTGRDRQPPEDDRELEECPNSELMKLPAFRNLLAKVETNFCRNRPKEAAQMEQSGTLSSFMLEQASQAWEVLANVRAKGMPMFQAEELIAEFVYPPLESDEDQYDR